MRAIVCFLLLARGDAAQAGAAYQQGLDELKKGRFEEAARKFAEALSHVPQETDKLLYRDDAGRHADPYYPHYGWAQARMRQAEGEPADGRKRQLLEEAIAHLGLSKHASAGSATEEARAKLQALDKAIPLPPDPAIAAIAALKGKVDDLCARQQFEDAQAAVEAGGPLWTSRRLEKEALLKVVLDRRAATLEGCRNLMDAGLENLASLDPTEKPDSVLPLLRPALVSAAVQREPDEPFRWLAAFTALFERERDALGRAASLEPEAALRAADAFERAAEEAASVGSLAGFRAARGTAHALRWARARTLAAGPAEKSLSYLEACDRAGRRCEETLRQRRGKLAAAAADRYVRTELAAQSRQVAGLRTDIERRAGLAADVGAAERALLRRGTMADPEALRRVSVELSELEAAAAFAELPASIRARAYFTRALAEATADFLEGLDAERVAERCGPTARRAFGLDAKADAPWKDRLSPKLRAMFEGLRQ